MATKKIDLGFKTWREEPKRVYSDVGSPIHSLYSGKYDDEGRIVLEEVGKENLYEYIQSFAQMTDINNIIKQYENGNTDILNRVQGFYFDCSEVPKNMPELLNKFNEAERGFMDMPPEFREMYGNDFATFICNYDPMDFMQLTPEEIKRSVEKEVEKEVENEQKHE